jgi:uncharacterized protein YggE
MKERTITVKGTGNVSTKPDLVVIEMRLETTEKDHALTLDHATKGLDALRAAITSAGHDGKELKTTSFNIQTKYESYKVLDDWKQRFVGYTCTHGLRLEFDFDMSAIGRTLGAIAVCESAPQFSIRFSVKDPAAVKEQSLESAVSNAAEKARILARAAGVKLGAIAHINYSWGELRLYSETDMKYGRALKDCAAAPMAMDIEPDDINVSDDVTIIWTIE